MKRTSVLLADDHVMFVDGLVHLVRQEFDIVGVARDGRAMDNPGTLRLGPQRLVKR